MSDTVRPTRTANPIAAEAFPLWLDLVGIDRAHFDERAKEFGGSTTLSQLDRMHASLAIHECLAIPDNELTAQLMLARYLDSYAAGRKFTLKDLLDKPATVQDKWDKALAIRKILDRDALMLQRAGFAASLSEAMVHYGAAGREDVQALLEDDIALAQLRRDAYYGLDELRIHQFLDGAPGDAGRPAYNTMIRRWWRMEDLLAATAHFPEGVSLNLICPGQEHELFFCFTVRRGARIYLLHDAPENAHPLQGQMSRSPGRSLERRMAQFWFPYETAGVRLEDKGRQVRMETDSQALSLPGRFQDYSRPLCHVADLPPQELLWAVMMFDRIMDRFWGNTPLPQLPLSYAAGHLRPETRSLADEAQAAGLPVVFSASPILVVPDLTRAEVTSLISPAEDLGEVGALHDRAWLMEKYAEQVPEAAFNLVASGVQHARLSYEGALVVAEGPAQEVDFFERDRAPTELNQLDPAHFGTAEELIADRRFIARSNLARSVTALAAREYKDRRPEIIQWLIDRYATRRDFLLSLVAHAHADALRIQDWKEDDRPEHFEITQPLLQMELEEGSGSYRQSAKGLSHAIAQLSPMKSDGPSYQAVGAFMPYLRAPGEREDRFRPTCQVTGAAPSWWLVVRPANAVELAWLLGMERSELPDVLRNFTCITTPYGNSILDRIDPLLWALDDPWLKLEKGMRLALSKRGLAQLVKQPGPLDLAPLHGASLRLYRGLDSVSATAPTSSSIPQSRRRKP